ncbi:MAG: FKBP-type peptidyl-prolyl cis-trans isomerase [Sphingobacteriales bacterium]|nr:MAG: FKBP-type peptidyl-prolyl cis-trans isomerase [Sphingobacteriales bacterium]
MSLQDKLKAFMNQKTTSQVEEGQKFLEENGKRPEVTTTASGLQYEVLTEGQGQRPSGPSSRVTVHYEGRLINGSVFDSSYKRNQPATFGLNQVISGWTEGVQLMPQGSKYRFYIPSELGYGSRGAGSIPPNSTLIFDVELLQIA